METLKVGTHKLKRQAEESAYYECEECGIIVYVIDNNGGYKYFISSCNGSLSLLFNTEIWAENISCNEFIIREVIT